ncbi:hypothetical protein K1X76_08035 [bacterium]|nr:hypothetical protein [bacterium]
MLSYSPELQDIILRYLKTNFLPPRMSGRDAPFNKKDYEYFAKGAYKLSTAFTEDKQSIPGNYFNDPILRSGYILYFLPVNLLKMVKIINEMKPSTLTTGNVRVLDLGSGPGSMALGMMQAYFSRIMALKKDVWLDFTLVDQNFTILKDAKNMHDAYADHLSEKSKLFRSQCSVKNFDFRRMGLNRFLRNMRFHYIMAGNVLNEFHSRDEQLQFLKTLVEHHLEPKNGKIILVEPATKKTSRDLQYLRDELVVHDKILTVEAPCLHQNECPLNVINKRDWCHFYFAWEKPELIERVDKLIGNQKDWLMCSYMVLSPTGEVMPQPIKDSWRVISNVMPSKGKKELVLCGPPGRYHVTRLDKNKSLSNASLDKIRRGDIVIHPISPNAPYTVDGQMVLDKKDSIKIL